MSRPKRARATPSRRTSSKPQRAARVAAPGYAFTNTWAAPHENAWRGLIDAIEPRHMLEVGCYEGRATTLMIEAATRHNDVRMTCIDTWAGSVDLSPEAMAGVEQRFDRNVTLAIARADKRKRIVSLRKVKAASAIALSALLARQDEHHEFFDLIYIDGSHTAPDVLTDAVLAFRLLAVGGVMVFDDYKWCMESAGQQDVLNMPKPAIDTFVNMFMRKLTYTGFGAEHAQYAVRKTAA